MNISELSAFTEKGILEATASVSQTPQRQTHISLNGRGVPVNILQQWGWPELPLTGDGNIQLTASGDIQANAPLKPTVSGQWGVWSGSANLNTAAATFNRVDVRRPSLALTANSST